MTPANPKSGEHDDQTAPTLAQANMPIRVSGTFGIKAATRSPGAIPLARKAAVSRPTCSYSCA